MDGIFVEEAEAEPRGITGRPPLLLLHGICHGAWCWENWLAELPRRGWHTFTMALRNHPGSNILPRETYCRETTLEDYVNDVSTVARHIGHPCVAVGHSMGGLVMQRFVETRTDADLRPAGMILAAATAPAQFGIWRPEALPEERPVLFDKEVARHYFLSKVTDEVAERVLGRLVGESPSVMNQYSRPPGVAIDPAKVDCPTLVISAELDRTIVPSDDRLAGFYGADYHLAKNIGHGLMLETGWEKVLDVVCGWLEETFPGGDC